MIVYCCADLIFATKVRATAQALDVVTRPTRDAQALQKRLDQVDDGRANDPVAAVIVDLEAPGALELIDRTKVHDSAIPVIAFGPHVALDLLAQARQRGADPVLPRSAFTARLEQLLQTYAGGEGHESR